MSNITHPSLYIKTIWNCVEFGVMKSIVKLSHWISDCRLSPIRFCIPDSPTLGVLFWLSMFSPRPSKTCKFSELAPLRCPYVWVGVGALVCSSVPQTADLLVENGWEDCLVFFVVFFRILLLSREIPKTLHASHTQLTKCNLSKNIHVQLTPAWSSRR